MKSDIVCQAGCRLLQLNHYKKGNYLTCLSSLVRKRWRAIRSTSDTVWPVLIVNLSNSTRTVGSYLQEIGILQYLRDFIFFSPENCCGKNHHWIIGLLVLMVCFLSVLIFITVWNWNSQRMVWFDHFVVASQPVALLQSLFYFVLRLVDCSGLTGQSNM